MSAPSKWDGWHRYALDFESTGTDAHEARVVTAAFVEIPESGRPTARKWVVDPGVEIPTEATEVHGYTRQRAIAEATHSVDQMLFEVTGLVARALGQGYPVVVYNAPYDITLLEAENRRHGIDPLYSRLPQGQVSPIVDPLILAKHAAPKRLVTVKDEHNNPVYPEGSKATLKRCRNCRCGATTWKLDSTCLHYGVRLTGAHDAAADALAAGRLFPRIMAAHRDKFPGLTMPGLHQAQIGWAKKQAEDLRGIFNWLKVDDPEGHPDCTPADHRCVCPEWPLHRACSPALVGGAR